MYECIDYTPEPIPTVDGSALEARISLLSSMFDLNVDQMNTLRNYSYMVDEIEATLLTDAIDDDQKASLQMTLDAFRINAFSSNAAATLISTNLSLPYDPLWEIYFSAQVAVLRSQHPTWSSFKLYWEASKEMIHMALDIGGLVPVIGEVCDLTNGAIYLIQGDGINASLSLVSAIPIAGYFSTGAKFAIKAVDATGSVKTTLKWIKKTNGVLDFGLRSQLRKTLKLLPGDVLQAHHLIPWEFTEHAVVQKAAQWGFHMNEALNGIGLAKSVHVEGMVHQTYNNIVRGKLDEILQNFGDAQGNINAQVAETQLINLTNQIRAWITAHPAVNLNNITL